MILSRSGILVEIALFAVELQNVIADAEPFGIWLIACDERRRSAKLRIMSTQASQEMSSAAGVEQYSRPFAFRDDFSRDLCLGQAVRSNLSRTFGRALV